MTDAALVAKLGNIRFFSATWRLFRLDGLDSAGEDYGQAVVYRGTLPGEPVRLALDKRHAFDAGRVVPVSGNTWRMLHDSRLRSHFDFIGSFEGHYGPFAGEGPAMPFDTTAPAADADNPAPPLAQAPTAAPMTLGSAARKSCC